MTDPVDTGRWILSVQEASNKANGKVICQNAGQYKMCKGCGAAVPHNPDYCEPCPVDETAICKTF